jgi:site-specific DNA-cytosine methylase
VADATAGVQERIRRSRVRLGTDRFLTQHTSDHHGTLLSEPIRTITTKDQWAVVDDDRYRRYRPLTIRETARAMGFPDDYGWPSSARRREVITGLGNTVPPDLGKVVIESSSGSARVFRRTVRSFSTEAFTSSRSVGMSRSHHVGQGDRIKS